MDSITQRELWIEKIIGRMSLEDKIGQCFMGNFCGADSIEHIRRNVQQYRFGGMQLSLVFQIFARGGDYKPCKVSRWRPMLEIAEWLHKINQVSYEELGVPCFIGIDREYGGGILKRCNPTEFPSGMGFDAAGDINLYYKAAKIQARESRALGANMIYGPVMDLATNPNNPEVNIRPYSDDPRAAGSFAVEYINACKEEGIVCTAKHFPGRGRGCSNAHLELETVDIPQDEYERTDLEAFRLAIEAGTPGIMVGHTHFAVYQTEQRPASLSKEVISGILRQRFGFNGLVIPDTLTMFAVSKNFSVPEAAVMALEAGNDQIFMKVENLYQPCIDAIKEAVKTGRITEKEMDAKVRRILETKWNASIVEPIEFEPDRITEILSDPESVQLAQEAARKSAVLIESGKSIPVRPDGNKNILVIARRELGVVLHNDPLRRHDELAAAIQKRHANTTFLLVDSNPTEDQLYEADALLQNADLIIMVFNGPDKEMIKLFQRLRDAKKFPTGENIPVVVINFGVPYIFDKQINGFDAAIQGFGYMKPTVEAAVAVLFGEVSTSGILPVNAGPKYPKGYGL